MDHQDWQRDREWQQERQQQLAHDQRWREMLRQSWLPSDWEQRDEVEGKQPQPRRAG